MSIAGRQQGASLLIVLLMLVVVMLFGVSAAQLTLMNEKSSRNDRDRHIAFQAAEAGLRDAERDIAVGQLRPVHGIEFSAWRGVAAGTPPTLPD